MTSPIKLAYEGVAKRFGGVDVFEDVCFAVPAGTVTALIGPNGAGKSTLINLTCGVFPADGGTIRKDGTPLALRRPSAALGRSLARTFQDVRLFTTLTVRENLLVAQPREDPAAADALLEQLGLTADAERVASDLPFGSQKLVALARAIATGADTLLLDETTTGLELTRIPLVLAMLRELRAQGRTIVLVEHNMDVVGGVADQVVVLHGSVIACGSAGAVLHDERVIREYLGRIYA